MLVCEDGSLLAFPHPAPGVPTLPTHGMRRWALDREDDTYTVTVPETGRVLHFTVHTDDLALLSQIDDRNGNGITFEYDDHGAPTSTGDQELLRYGYTDGHLTFDDRTQSYTYDAAGRLTSTALSASFPGRRAVSGGRAYLMCSSRFPRIHRPVNSGGISA